MGVHTNWMVMMGNYANPRTLRGPRDPLLIDGCREWVGGGGETVEAGVSREWPEPFNQLKLAAAMLGSMNQPLI